MRPEAFMPDDLFSQIAALDQALDAERQARLAADAQNAAKSDLLATVSHELRNPMGAVISMAELLRASKLDETQARYAETLQSAARSLLTVLNDILDFSKLDAGGFTLEPRDFDLHALLKGCGDQLAALAAGKGLAASADIAAACPKMARGDVDRLRQILGNLIVNAVKFTESGSVRIEADCVAREGRVVLRCAIIDTGIGIGPAQRTKLFTPYVQADRNTARRYGGTGLGLAIARRLVELMGGRIGCESAPGEGSRFWFAVPLDQASAGPAPRACASGALEGHVLIVEDNAVNRMLIGAYLDNFGMTHEEAPSGEAALAMFGTRFDIVLMDIMMPDMDGLETARRLRARGATLPIVALTAAAMRGDRDAAIEAGMTDYLAKPIHAASLHAALSRHLAAPETELRAAG
jgi:CheY-like chemotaxis protein